MHLNVIGALFGCSFQSYGPGSLYFHRCASIELVGISPESLDCIPAAHGSFGRASACHAIEPASVAGQNIEFALGGLERRSEPVRSVIRASPSRRTTDSTSQFILTGMVSWKHRQDQQLPPFMRARAPSPRRRCCTVLARPQLIPAPADKGTSLRIVNGLARLSAGRQNRLHPRWRFRQVFHCFSSAHRRTSG